MKAIRIRTHLARDVSTRFEDMLHDVDIVLDTIGGDRGQPFSYLHFVTCLDF